MIKLIKCLALFGVFFLLMEKVTGQVLDSAFLQAKYRLLYRPDSNKQTLKEDILVLDIGQKFTKFSSYYQMVIDSIARSQFNKQNNMEGASISLDLRDIPTGSTKIILRNNKTNIFTVSNQLGLNTYRYADSVKDLKWTILSDTATFLGYKCTKANTRFRGRDYEAWFAPEIAVPLGPHLFSGLPGLIVNVKEKKGNFEFNLFSLEIISEKKPISLENKKFLTITRKEYRKLVQNMYDNIDAFAASQGMIFQTKSINGDTNPPPPPKIIYNPLELE